MRGRILLSFALGTLTACSLLVDTDGLDAANGGLDGSAIDPPSGAGENDGASADTGPDIATANAPPVACDPNETPAAGAVFVSITAGNDDAGTGGSTAPLKTLAKGLAKAVADARTELYLAAGNYAGALALVDAHSALSLHGGWTYIPASASWKRDCAGGPSAVVLQGTGTNVSVTFTTALKAISLEHMTLETTGPGAKTAERGGNAYGVFLQNKGAIRLFDVNVIVSKAQDGTSPGTPSTPSGCAAFTSCSGTTPPPGAVGNNGTPTSASFGAAGWQATLGTSGSDGSPGVNGTPGGAPTTYGPCLNCTAAGTNCLSPPPPTTTVTGTTPGTCGCGGKGGKGGTPGPAGGAAVGIFASGASAVTVKAVGITIKGGGAGALGGAGGSGGSGGMGAHGATAGCDNSCAAFGGACTSTSNTYYAGSGAPGGTGATGGKGGNGGGGPGGPSAGIVSLGAATSLTIDEVVFAVAAGGAGQGGAANGTKDDRLALP